MKNHLENLLLVVLLAVALSACSSASKKVVSHDGAVEPQFAREIAGLETALDEEAIKNTSSGPRKTIMKKEVHWNAQGLEGQCYILEGGKVRKSSGGYEKTSKIPAQIHMRGSVITYNEDVLRTIAERSFSGNVLQVSQGTIADNEGPLVTYAAFGKSNSGVAKAKILKIKNYEGSVYLNSVIGSSEPASIVEVIDAVCK